MSAPTYAAEGSVRGNCGHKHRTIEGAAACADRDQRACASQGAGCYSDRIVVRTDGMPLTDAEEQAIEDRAEYLAR